MCVSEREYECVGGGVVCCVCVCERVCVWCGV